MRQDIANGFIAIELRQIYKLDEALDRNWNSAAAFPQQNRLFRSTND
ncbi:hypothetical protein MIM_c28170 [Advenella mimigardefordensis DPN7]|uniref:Uncharacterized protein n=1 Tax=Advenella mimigardefordensis (strain DSM 17166 / LMG 22922 / DPN7) TaxID=1247726 RepID=W0PHG0_ADVMD|nr:hypothetical protein MIM_c28170 [Advenella mimigardefordensis DPN7]